MIREAKAIWQGNLRDGKGSVALGSGAFEGSYSFKTRFEDAPGTNPEELIAAAHAACFSMALSAILTSNGQAPDSIETLARVSLEKLDDGFQITEIALTTEVSVPNISIEEFSKFAEAAKYGCPVSKALSGVLIKLEAKLINKT